MRRFVSREFFVLWVSVLASAGTLLGTCSASPALLITEYPLPSANGTPQFITGGPDGNLWFTETSADGSGTYEKIGRILVDNPTNITEFSLPTNSMPISITAGPDGNLWFTEYGTDMLGRITTDGTIQHFPLPSCGSACMGHYPFGITNGPGDGNLWFTELLTNHIGRITTSGVITEFTVPNAMSTVAPAAITVGPDNNLWFTEYLGNQIGKIVNGAMALKPVPDGKADPLSITAAGDGNLWFTENGNLGSNADNKIGRITTGGTITEFTLPTALCRPLVITTGPDGNLWFTENASSKLGSISLDGNISEFPIPTANSNPGGITTGPDGNLWFTEASGQKIAMVNLGQDPSPTPTVVLPTSTPSISPSMTATATPGRIDAVVQPVNPINIIVPIGSNPVTRNVRVMVTNGDGGGVVPTQFQLAASSDCPVGVIVGPPRFISGGSSTDIVSLAAGRTATALVPLIVHPMDFTNPNAKAPSRCTLTFTATALAPGNTDPTPANNTMTAELNVVDRNVMPFPATGDESVITSLPPLLLKIPTTAATVFARVRPRVTNANIVPVPETTSRTLRLTVNLHSCPGIVVNFLGIDANPKLPGQQASVALKGGASATGLVELTVDALRFKPTSARSPARCTATFTVSAGGGEADTTNNTTRMVINAVPCSGLSCSVLQIPVPTNIPSVTPSVTPSNTPTTTPSISPSKTPTPTPTVGP